MAAFIVVVLLVIIISKVSASKRPCPHCHAMMPTKKTTCPNYGREIPINY